MVLSLPIAGRPHLTESERLSRTPPPDVTDDGASVIGELVLPMTMMTVMTTGIREKALALRLRYIMYQPPVPRSPIAAHPIPVMAFRRERTRGLTWRRRHGMEELFQIWDIVIVGISILLVSLRLVHHVSIIIMPTGHFRFLNKH